MDDQGKLARAAAVSTKREASVGMDQGMRVLSYLIAGVGVYGFLGWLGDHLLGTRFLLPIGIVAGAAFGVYVIIRRFGPAAGLPTPGRVGTAHPVTGKTVTGKTVTGKTVTGKTVIDKAEGAP